MARLWKRHLRLCWSLALAMVFGLMSSGRADAQMMGFGMGYPAAGWGGYGYGYGYPGFMGYGYAPYGFGGYGYGYPGMGYGYGYPYPGIGFAPGYAGFYGTGYGNPLFGVGMTPLGAQSYMMETRLLGRLPRVSNRYYSSAYNRPPAFRGW